MDRPRTYPLVLMAALSLSLGSCQGSGVVAQVGSQALTAEQLAQIMTAWGRTPRDTNVATQIATWWMEYQLFAERVVAGDSLLDSAIVLDVLWTEARAYVLARWRELLFASELPLDSQALDSVYRAGEYRLIQHVLIGAPERESPEARARAEARADALSHRLALGLSWEAAQRHSEDVNARVRSGSVGIILRGQTEPEFERVAFALEPGAISGVIPSSYGFHIARRPPLAEVRVEFRTAVEPIIAHRLDSLHMRDLAERWRLSIEEDGLERAREAVSNPLEHLASQTVIARYDGGRFTQQDLVRWLEGVPDRIHSELERGAEADLIRFLERMMHFELLYREARMNGVDVSPEEFRDLKLQLARRLAEVQELLRVYPPAPGDSASIGELERRAADRVERFLLSRPSDWQRFARVPARLVDRLKRGSRWSLRPRGIDRALRLMMDTSVGRRDTPSADPSGDTTRVPH